MTVGPSRHGRWRKRGDSNAQGCNPYLCSGQAPHPAGSLPGLETVASSARFERASPPSEGGALSTELRRVGVDGRTRTCVNRFRRPVPDPFGHVDMAPPTGFAPATSGLTDRRSSWLSYGGSVRALGLEPSLFRGKSPVPYQSGVTRMGSAARHRATDPVPRAGGPRPGEDASAVVKELVPGLVIRNGTLGRSRTSCLRVWRPRRRRDSSARCGRAHDGLRAVRQQVPRRCWSEKGCAYQRWPGLPIRSALPSRHACAMSLDGR